MRLQQLIESHMPDRLFSLLHELTPDDIGVTSDGEYTLAYEGFTPECWEDYDARVSRGEISSEADIEKEILREWNNRLTGKKLIDHGWVNQGISPEPDVFWALYRGDLNEASRKPWLRVTDTMLDQAQGLKSQIIVEMPASDFLAMTTPNREIADRIRAKAARLRDYNRGAKMGHDSSLKDRFNRGKSKDDPDYQWGTIHMPFLTIELSDDGSQGTVVGHEGRHRAAAVEREGSGTMRVALIVRPGKDMFPDSFGREYKITSEHLPAAIKGEFNSRMHSTKGWKVLKDNYHGRLKESLDKTYEYEWTKEPGAYWTTTVDTKFGQLYIEMRRMGIDSPMWDIFFSVGGRSINTGAGDQFRVVATVTKAIGEFLREVRPEIVTFEASKRQTASRAKLYYAIARKYSNELGYELEVKKSPTTDTFFLRLS